MDDEQLVDPNLGMWSSFEMWMMMRQLRGFELPEFLDGCRHAYPAVCGLMYTREWDALEPMVSPKCLEAMQAMMEEFGSAARRIQVEDVEEDFQVQSALLTKVMLIDDDETDGPNCHLDVKVCAPPPVGKMVDCTPLDARSRGSHRITSGHPRPTSQFLVHESYKIFDFHTNSVIEPFDGRKRPQESTWRFEGRVSEDDGDAGWKLFALV